MSDMESEAARARAAGIYAARSALAETKAARRRVGTAEIVRYLADPRLPMSADLQKALFASPVLRQDFRRLKSARALSEMPVLAAASTGEIKSRRFSAGTISLHPSRVPGQTYVVIRGDWQQGLPSALLVEGPSTDIAKRALPAPDARGEILLVLDEGSADDAKLLELLFDPQSSGSFLP